MIHLQNYSPGNAFTADQNEMSIFAYGDKLHYHDSTVHYSQEQKSNSLDSKLLLIRVD